MCLSDAPPCSLFIYIYIYICICVHICIHIYIYRERERHTHIWCMYIYIYIYFCLGGLRVMTWILYSLVVCPYRDGNALRVRRASFAIWSNRKTLITKTLNVLKPWARKHQIVNDTSAYGGEGGRVRSSSWAAILV